MLELLAVETVPGENMTVEGPPTGYESDRRWLVTSRESSSLGALALQDGIVAPPWRRRRFQLSVRVFLFIFLILDVILAWVVRRALVQRDAVTAIVHGGGSVFYDWEWPGFRIQADGRIAGGIPVQKGDSPWPKWMIDRLGPDYFAGCNAGLCRCQRPRFSHGACRPARWA